ncbi:LAME_0G18096g1_1 [Lachancea meyersii CBS 8951]|uniref:LAME_0G18096g1_1 n=1 Tax=Lachancea meyersii CBS 8951 TaxID=1266667 RepID=A0A1G4KBR6_9SACH|nr:LAME_0G18096g1_1 [Lachancea meyersii CBS 8951]
MGNLHDLEDKKLNSGVEQETQRSSGSHQSFDKWTSNDFIDAIRKLFDDNGVESKKYENVLLIKRAFSNHAASKEFLVAQVHKNIPITFEVFNSCGPETIDTLLGCFEGQEASKELLTEIQKALDSDDASSSSMTGTIGHATHSHKHDKYTSLASFLLIAASKLLEKYEFDFEEFKPLVKSTVLRCHGDFEHLTVLISLCEKHEEQLQRELLAVFNTLFQEAQSDFSILESYLLMVISVLQMLYLQMTSFCTEVFLSEQFQTVAQQNFFTSGAVTHSILDLMSTACIDNLSRTFIAETYFDLLYQCRSIENFKSAATLVILKTWNFKKLKPEMIDEMAIDLEKQFDGSNTLEAADRIKRDELAVEGLAYLTLKPSVKKLLISNSTLRTHLISYLGTKETPSAMYYGILIIFGNLSDPLTPNTQNERTMQNLREYTEANHKSNSTDTNPLKESSILKFVSECILSHNIIGTVRTHLKRQKLHGSGARYQLLRLIHNAARTKALITKSVEQGSITILLESLALSGIPSEVRILALRALARSLMAVNPQLVFRNFSALNALPLLFELLPDTTRPAEANLLAKDTYEALLALTNLATLSESGNLCQKIVSTPAYWNKVENLMVDSVVENQRSTLELLSNLMASSLHVAVKFFNFENPVSVRNFNILVKLLNLDDRNSRLAVAAILANIASSVPFIAQELAGQDELIETALIILRDQSEDAEMRHRLIVFFDAVINSGVQTKALSGRKSELKGALLEAKKYEKASNSDYLTSINDSLSKLKI